MIVVTGEPGVGKSRLTSAVEQEARHRGWTVASGRAYGVLGGTQVHMASLSSSGINLSLVLDDEAVHPCGDGASRGIYVR